MVSLECDEVVPSHEAPVQNPSPETLSACGESLDLVSVLERLDLMCRKEVRAAPRPDRPGMPRGPPPADPAPSRGYWDRAPTPPAPKRSCPVSESNFHGRGRAARPPSGALALSPRPGRPPRGAPSRRSPALTPRAPPEPQDRYMANENYIAKIQHNGMKESWRKKIALWFQQVRALAPSRPAPQPERRTETPAARAPPRRSQLATAFQLNPQTLHLAINLLDRYLSRKSCTSVRFQCVPAARAPARRANPRARLAPRARGISSSPRRRLSA